MVSDSILLFVNRRAGAGAGSRRVEELRGLLEVAGASVTEIRSVDGLREYVASEVESSCIVAAGGDGTIETVANETGGRVPIAVLPLGTENLLARYFGIKPDPKRLVELIKAGHTIRLDAGRANGKLFLVMLSCGFDADVVRRVHRQRQGNITHLAWARPMVESIFSYDYPNIRVSWERSSEWETIDCHWAFLFNAPVYAAGLRIVNDGDPSDGLLEVATFAGGSLWHGLRQFSAVMLGQHNQLPDFQLNRAARIRIDSEHENVPYQIDGDPGGILPVEVDLLPQHMTLIVDKAKSQPDT